MLLISGKLRFHLNNHDQLKELDFTFLDMIMVNNITWCWDKSFLLYNLNLEFQPNQAKCKITSPIVHFLKNTSCWAISARGFERKHFSVYF